MCENEFHLLFVAYRIFMRTHLEGSQFLLLSDKQEDDEAAAGTHN